MPYSRITDSIFSNLLSVGPVSPTKCTDGIQMNSCSYALLTSPWPIHFGSLQLGRFWLRDLITVLALSFGSAFCFLGGSGTGGKLWLLACCCVWP